MKTIDAEIIAERTVKMLDQSLSKPFKHRFTELLRARIADLVLLEQHEIGRRIDT